MNTKPRRWWIAGLASYFIPGLGQTYNGEFQKGLILLVLKLLISLLSGILIMRGWNIALLKAINFFYDLGVAGEAAFRSKSVDVSELIPETLRSGYRRFFAVFGCFVLIPIFTYIFLFQAFKIPSGAMEDTLLIGDHLLVNKFIYGTRVPFTDTRLLKLQEVRRGDLLTFRAPPASILSAEDRARHVKKDFIKRVVGLPSDVIQIQDKQLFVNSVRQTENYVTYKDPKVYPPVSLGLSPTQYQTTWESGKFAELRREQVGDNFGPIKVPDDCYFVLGDNRDGSFDSRFWGPLPSKFLIGKAVLIYYPLKRRRSL